MNNIKNTKTVLFASLIAAMIIPFSGVGSASAWAPQGEEETKVDPAFEDTVYVEYLLNKMAPFISQGEGNFLSFDVKGAYNTEFTDTEINHALIIVQQLNEIISGERENIELLHKFFESQEESPEDDPFGGMSTQGSSRGGGEAECKWNAQKKSPPKVTYWTGKKSVNDAKSYLEKIGYDQVTVRHSTQSDDDFNRNYQKSIEAHGCESGVFRTEAYIQGNGESYRTQTPEPNPEVLDGSYSWPVAYWPAYVAWWHNNY